MKKAFLLLICFGLCAGNVFAFAQCEVTGEIVLSPAGEPVFKSKIRNTTTHLVVIPEAELPWRFREKLVVRVIYPDRNAIEPREADEQLVQGVPNGEVVLAPDQMIEGVVELKDIVQALSAKALHQREVLVVWYHSFGWTTDAPRLVTGLCHIRDGKVENYKAAPADQPKVTQTRRNEPRIGRMNPDQSTGSELRKHTNDTKRPKTD